MKIWKEVIMEFCDDHRSSLGAFKNNFVNPSCQWVLNWLYKLGLGYRVYLHIEFLYKKDFLHHITCSCQFLMEGTTSEVTLEEFKLFHGIDRELYTILVRDLCRNPSECLHIMGLWLWLERGGFNNVISKVLHLPPFLINELADEAVACLNMINDAQYPLSVEVAEISLTHVLVDREISFHRLNAYHEIQNLVSDIYIPVLADIMERARHGGFSESSMQSRMFLPAHALRNSSLNQTMAPSSFNGSLTQSFASLSIGNDAFPSQGSAQDNEPSRYERTMFVTFSKGYPVSENEVRQFFTRIFGHCIESLHMQEVGDGEQSLYARIMFLSPSFIQMILNGVDKAKFTINGKHVWMRKFVLKNGRLLPCRCPSTGACTCPH